MAGGAVAKRECGGGCRRQKRVWRGVPAPKESVAGGVGPEVPRCVVATAWLSRDSGTGRQCALTPSPVERSGLEDWVEGAGTGGGGGGGVRRLEVVGVRSPGVSRTRKMHTFYTILFAAETARFKGQKNKQR